jgi:hypothetical protein
MLYVITRNDDCGGVSPGVGKRAGAHATMSMHDRAKLRLPTIFSISGGTILFIRRRLT